MAEGEDERARGWRSRRVAQLLRDAFDAWDEAAVWSALLGPELVDSAVPDPCERAYLRTLRASLPPGRPGLATPEQIRAITTADRPDEIAPALVALADALGRARRVRPAPGAAVGAATDRSPGAASSASSPEPPEPTEVAWSVAEAAEPAWAAGEPHDGRPGLRGLLRRLGRRHRPAGAPAAGCPFGRLPGVPHNSPTSVTRSTARASSSEAARSTSAEMPQP